MGLELWSKAVEVFGTTVSRYLSQHCQVTVLQIRTSDLLYLRFRIFWKINDIKFCASYIIQLRFQTEIDRLAFRAPGRIHGTSKMFLFLKNQIDFLYFLLVLTYSTATTPGYYVRGDQHFNLSFMINKHTCI